VTITSQAPIGFDRRPRHRRTAKHSFFNHQPQHRQRTIPAELTNGSRTKGSLRFGRGRRRIEALEGRDYRAWGAAISALAAIGFVATHLAGATQASAVFATVGVLTWGQALAVLLPTEDATEYSMLSVATSAAVLILGGMLMVGLRLTGAFFVAFVCIWALCLLVEVAVLAIQIISYRRESTHPQPAQSVRYGKFIPPQPVPSMQEGKLDPLPVPSMQEGGLAPGQVPTMLEHRLAPLPVPSMLDERFSGGIVDLAKEVSVPISDQLSRLPALIPGLGGAKPLSVPSLEVSTSKARRSQGWSLPLTFIGFIVAIVTAFADRHLDPGLWGLPGSISPVWYLGLVLIIGGIATARRSDGVEIGVAVTALVLVVTGTATIVYDLPHVPWFGPHIGVVSYILHFGNVQADIDIHQAWPGLFAAAAWISRAGSIGDPVTLARVWPPVIDVLCLVAFRCFAGRLLGSNFRAWIASGVFLLAAAFSQDYFSPQAIGLLLALSIYAVVVPVTTVGSAAGAVRFRLPAWRIAVVVVLSLALAVTHQITPYFVVASLTVLVAFGLLRPVWIPLVPLVPAAVWALLNYEEWKGYFSFDKIFDLGATASTPGASIVGEHPDLVLRLSTDALAAGPLVVGILAVLFLLRNHGRLEMALALSAASAGSLVLVVAYGQEGLYRTTLFALPWLCVLALGGGPKGLFRRTQRIVPLLALLTASFLFASFALDGMNDVRPSELQAERSFELKAPPGSMLVYVGPEDVPGNATYRYPQMQPYEEPLSGKESINSVVTSLIQMGRGYPTFYVATTQAAIYAGELYGLYSPQYYTSLTSALRASPHFKIVQDQGGTQVFELRAPTRP
jgi:hypothetical protein